MYINLRNLRAPMLTELPLVEHPLPSIPEAVAEVAPVRDRSPFVGRRLARYVERRGALLAEIDALRRDLFEPCDELEASTRLREVADAQRLARDAWAGVTAITRDPER